MRRITIQRSSARCTRCLGIDGRIVRIKISATEMRLCRACWRSFVEWYSGIRRRPVGLASLEAKN